MVNFIKYKNIRIQCTIRSECANQKHIVLTLLDNLQSAEHSWLCEGWVLQLNRRLSSFLSATILWLVQNLHTYGYLCTRLEEANGF